MHTFLVRQYKTMRDLWAKSKPSSSNKQRDLFYRRRFFLKYTTNFNCYRALGRSLILSHKTSNRVNHGSLARPELPVVDPAHKELLHFFTVPFRISWIMSMDFNVLL